MTMSPEFRDYLLDMLRPLGVVSARAMFGGGGLYLDGTMFALVFDDTLYLKADEQNRGDFEARGMDPFTYEIEGRPGAVEMSYWEAPPELLDDADELTAWGHRAWQAAKRASVKKKSRASANEIKRAGLPSPKRSSGVAQAGAGKKKPRKLQAKRQRAGRR